MSNAKSETANTVRSNRSLPPPPHALIDFMASGWLDAPRDVSVHPQIARFRSRREALSRAFPGEYLLVDSGCEPMRSGGAAFRFRASSDFAYLAGPSEPGALLVLEPEGSSHRSRLFVPEYSRDKAEIFRTGRLYSELWVGRRRSVAESQHYYGVEACEPLSRLKPYLESLKAAGHSLRLTGENTQLTAYFELDSDLATCLSEMRLIKDDYERSELRKAVEITKRGFEDAIRVLRHAKTERAIEGAFDARARIEANGTGWLTSAAAGEHTWALNWTRNDGELRSGDLLLLDACGEGDSLYCADVARTLPISGKFSAEQRAVYEIVHEALRVAIEVVRPGNAFLEPHTRAMRVLSEGLIELGILKCSLDEALDPERQYYRRYTLHNVSHMIGLDVVDCVKARVESYRHLREGMVLAVEPGLYLQSDDGTVPERFRGIGIRLEDDVAVTADGCDNYSAILPAHPDVVERWIAELQGTEG